MVHMPHNPSTIGILCKRACLSTLLITCITVPLGWAAAEPMPEEKLFDVPSANQELDATAGPHPAEALRCHWYADLMIRETATDSPGMGPSYVVHPGSRGARPVCRAAPGAGDIKLDVESQTLLGRKGSYVVYQSTDAPGAEPFVVLHLSDGHQVYTDQKSALPTKTSAAGLHAVTVEGDALHLRYLRAYDATCSLLKDGDACWSKAMKEGRFSRAIAAQSPPIADCRAAYKGSAEAASYPSTIVYDVDMTVTPDGKVSVRSRGPLGCLPTP